MTSGPALAIVKASNRIQVVWRIFKILVFGYKIVVALWPPCIQQLSHTRDFRGVILAGNEVVSLVRIGPQVEQVRESQIPEFPLPQFHSARLVLHLEVYFPVAVTQGQQVPVIGEVEEFDTRACLLLASEVGQEVVAVEVHREGLSRGLVPLEEFLLDVGFPRGRKQRRHPVEV